VHQKPPNVVARQFARMAFLMKKHETGDPLDIALARIGTTEEFQGLKPNSIQQPWLLS
jgi:hypothetical protein